jgi:hypothetical protein
MPQFDPELILVMKRALEDVMTRVPLEYSTPAAKAYLAECILKAAAQGLPITMRSSPGHLTRCK